MAAVIFLLVYAGMIYGGYRIGKAKGRTKLGVTLAILLGIIGWGILAFIPPTHASQVEREAKRQYIIEEAAQRIRQGEEKKNA
jgi:hypothetical protein